MGLDMTLNILSPFGREMPIVYWRSCKVTHAWMMRCRVKCYHINGLGEIRISLTWDDLAALRKYCLRKMRTTTHDYVRDEMYFTAQKILEIKRQHPNCYDKYFIYRASW